MEITNITKTGITRISDSLHVKYGMTGDQVENVTGSIHKNEEIVGHFNRRNNGAVGFSLNENNGLSSAEISDLFAHLMKDSVQVLGE